MDPESFRLQLPQREFGRIRLARFELVGMASAGHAGRRARLLGALTDLPKRRRNRMVKAVSTTVRLLVRRWRRVQSEWLLICRDGRYRLEVRLQLPGGSGETTLDNDTKSELEALVSRLSHFVDFCELRYSTSPTWCVALGQLLSVDFIPPGKSDVNDWREVLGQASAEEAMAALYRRSRDKIALLSEAVRRAELNEVGEDASEAETLTLLSLVASKTDNAVAILDATGVVDWVNDAFARMTGYPSRASVGKPLEHLLFGVSAAGPDVDRHRESLRAAKSLTEERLQYRSDGESYWGTVSLTPVFDEERRLVRWIVIGSDTTRRRQAQQALENAKLAAETANRAKSEFLANMSHEIRTPMNAVIGMTDLALSTSLTPEQQEYLTTVKGSAASLLQLLNDVLDLSKIEAARLEIDEIDFDLAEWLRETMRTLAVQASAKQLVLTWNLSQQVPTLLKGDPARLRQVLINLVGNAIKFTHRGEVAVDVQPQWQNDEEVCLVFAVKDTGIGIPADRLEQIFDAFTQVDASTTRDYGGTGLGLTISAQLLRLMQGRIWVTSRLGKGSTFSFSVRLRKSEAMADEPSVSPVSRDAVQRNPSRVTDADQNSRPIRVLVADDHTSNRRLIAGILAKRGHQLSEATNGQEVLKQLETDEIDVVLMDIQMPVMDGLQATNAIREAERRTPRHLPIIAVTAHAMKGDREACLAAGMDAYLSKPVDAEELVHLVESLGGMSGGAPVSAGPSLADEPKASSETHVIEDSSYDFNPALTRLAHDETLLRLQMEYFVEESPELILQLQNAIAAADFATLKLLAHRMKGLVRSFDHRQASELCTALEEMAHAQSCQGAESVLSLLGHHVEVLRDAIGRYLRAQACL